MNAALKFQVSQATVNTIKGVRYATAAGSSAAEGTAAKCCVTAVATE